MILLPSLLSNTQTHAHRFQFEEQRRIPVQTKRAFWKKVYTQLAETKFYSPVVRNIKQYINPLFGYFGLCVHPTTHEIAYFHAGVELEFTGKRKIFPVMNGILEYAGYGATNGYYVLLSHPEVQTEDGYVLHSMYCHLKKPLVKFSSYQKMLREISLGSYPQVLISTKQELGLAGSSGVTRDESPRLYLQMDFRKYGQEPIVLDPLMILNGEEGVNETAFVKSEAELEKMLAKIAAKNN